MQLGFIGLGKMGNWMVMKLLDEGHEVIVWNRSLDKISNFKFQISNLPNSQNFDSAVSIADLVKKLDKPRIIWSMLPAHSTGSGSETGDPTEEILSEISKYVEVRDIVIDGGNSKFSDTQRRYDSFKEKGIKFLGTGVSGGIIAAKEGYPMMAGGDREAYDHIKPILDSLAKPGGGHGYFGEGGAGHFVKMVHNAIEYGIMQSIGEGFGILEKSPYNLDLEKVARLYQKGTLVSGFMMERTAEVLKKDPELEAIEGVIGKASGETIWALEEAKKNGLPADVIQRSLDIRNESETDEKIQKSFAARMVAALRNAFGGHEVKKKSN